MNEIYFKSILLKYDINFVNKKRIILDSFLFTEISNQILLKLIAEGLQLAFFFLLQKLSSFALPFLG